MSNVREDFTPMERAVRGHVLRIAHRGASAYAPENSLQAFEKAAEMGADAVEIDIQITADDRPVVAHDENLQRVFGLNVTIGDVTLDQLGEMLPTDRAPIPTFEQVAAVCADLKLGLYLDIKRLNMAAAGHIFDSLAATGLMAYTIFGSFRPDFLAELKAYSPAIRTSILFGSTHVQPVWLARAVNADYVHPCWEHAAPEPHRLLTEAWLTAVRAANLGVVCWHEERPTEIAALSALGVDAICSDTPDVLARYS
ncbi:MAG: glycerophosphodiester phosphodiesterase [Anaerolineae bacterium]|nr:glycerophosphodiester phosphodiesterase [Anaerolineae bacterium]